jgi:hypothetical protein
MCACGASALKECIVCVYAYMEHKCAEMMHSVCVYTCLCMRLCMRMCMSMCLCAGRGGEHCSSLLAPR